MNPPVWDVLCRVVDHRGDAGVCWRLARALAMRHLQVRLWIDQPDALQGMADADDQQRVRQGRIRIHPWPEPAQVPPGDVAVVIETFGCGLPPAWLAAAGRLAQSSHPWTWVNLEYLSAEPYVERSHGLPSPQLQGAAAGATGWFFYPGFTPATGGLLQDVAVGPVVGAELGDALALGGFRVSRYDYDAQFLPAWLPELQQAAGDALMLLQPGRVPAEEPAWFPPAVSAPRLPWLAQADYDRLLAACDLNLVRGEDSFVRAQWAARPMLWQPYPQADGAHAAKLHAWLDHYLAGADADFAGSVRQAHLACSGLLPPKTLAPALIQALGFAQPAGRRLGWHWQQHAQAWATRLARQPDLATRLMQFVADKRA